MKSFLTLLLTSSALLAAPSAARSNFDASGVELNAAQEAMVKKMVTDHSINMPDDLKMSIRELRNRHMKKHLGQANEDGESEEGPEESSNL